MFRYGQFCPVSKSLEVLGERWSLLIVREMIVGRSQFNQLQHALPRISPTTLSKRLRELEEHDLIVRKRLPGQLGYEYRLTAAGKELVPVIAQLAEWGMRWARGRLRDDELDVDMLMSDIQRRIDRSKLPSGQTVLQFKFTDLDDYAEWWIKINDDDIEVCLEDPGHDVDVYFTSDVKTMIEVWMGDVPLRKAQSSGRLKIVGRGAYLRSMHAWFPLHALSGIRPALEGDG
jgi:DNA-binding HxlR family transcriptional regulator